MSPSFPTNPRYRAAFKALNEEWITAHWQMEEPDHHALDHPQEHILDKGGHIFVALYREEPVGVCALCRKDDPVHQYELAKLAVSPSAQGKGIGMLLCRTVIAKAKELGCKKIFLESNTLLRPAIQLYRKAGFREVEIYRPSYERVDIQRNWRSSNAPPPGRSGGRATILSSGPRNSCPSYRRQMVITRFPVKQPGIW